MKGSVYASSKWEIDPVNPQFTDRGALGAELLGWVYSTVSQLALENGTQLQTSRSKVLLTLLTYCYARGYYSAEQIASGTVADPNVRYICVRQVPEPAEIRRFRRQNKDLLIGALTELLRRVPGLETLSTDEAERVALAKIQRSIQEDSMDLDF